MVFRAVRENYQEAFKLLSTELVMWYLCTAGAACVLSQFVRGQLWHWSTGVDVQLWIPAVPPAR